MEISENITIITNIIVVSFLVWSLYRRKNIDDRIDKLAKILISVTDLLDKNRSWEKSANETKAMEEVYERKAKAEIYTQSQESLESAKNIKNSEIEASFHLAMMEDAIKVAVPDYYKSVIYASLILNGSSAEDRHTKVFFTTQEEVNKAFTMFAKAKDTNKYTPQ